MWIIVSVILLASFLLVQTISLYAISKNRFKSAVPEQWPHVSVLLAARNEEKLIERSLEHLANIDYPSDKLEVLIGDDSSEDNTYAIAKKFVVDKPQFKLFSISKNLGEGRGKANVLAHLAHQATGEFFFITDVDVAVSPQWVKELVAKFEPNVGIVSGTTTCVRLEESSWYNLQAIDWLHFMGYIQSFGEMGIACTSVGNNMAVRAKAYWETGGYEKMPFSITEDYRLFQHVTANKWDWRTVCNANALGLAWPIESMNELLHQRKRWLIGARDLTLFWKCLIVLYGLFLPVVILLLFTNWPVATAGWCLKFGLQSGYIIRLHKRVGLEAPSLPTLFIYEFYVLILTLLSAIFFFLPIPSHWKGRRYNSKGLH